MYSTAFSTSVTQRLLWATAHRFCCPSTARRIVATRKSARVRRVRASGAGRYVLSTAPSARLRMTDETRESASTRAAASHAALPRERRPAVRNMKAQQTRTPIRSRVPPNSNY
eukprot:6190521-Pleurochrysis_carterae.AAC.2